MLKKFGIGDIQLRKFRGAHRLEISREIKIGRQPERLFAGHFVVAVFGIAAQSAVHGSLGQRGLNAQHGLRCLGGLLRRLAGKRKHLSGIFHQVLAHLHHLGIVFDVVAAVGQRESALIEVGDHRIGIVQVGRRIKIEERIVVADNVHPRDRVNQCLAAATRLSSGWSGAKPAASAAFSSMQEA